MVLRYACVGDTSCKYYGHQLHSLSYFGIGQSLALLALAVIVYDDGRTIEKLEREKSYAK